LFRLLILLAAGRRSHSRLFLGRLARLLGLVRLRLWLFRLFAGRRKRGFVARFFAGLRLRGPLVFIAGQILRRRRFAGYVLDRSWLQCFSRRAFNWSNARTFVGINRSFLSVDMDRFALKISNGLRFVDDGYVVDNHIGRADRRAEAVYANKHKERGSHDRHAWSDGSPADVSVAVTP
jgi:hypothetical protein